MSKHTPGPWVLHRDWPTDVITAPNAPWSPSVAIIDIGPHDKEQIMANGALIAAAPDLLEAGRSILDTFEAWDGMSECPVTFGEIEALRNAIAKAEGA